jgi:archaemetzincin
MFRLAIIPILFSDTPVLEYLRNSIPRNISLQADIHNLQINPDFAFNSSRGQYNSTLILAKLLELFPNGTGILKGYERILGVTSCDLFIPILTFVFGEAQLGGRVAVVSSYRLENERYGLPKDTNLFHTRLVKESVHELGHTLGLIHCYNQDCALHPSTYVEEIDLKSTHFCHSCQTKVLYKMSENG